MKTERKSYQFSIEESDDEQLTISGFVSTFDEDRSLDTVHPEAYNRWLAYHHDYPVSQGLPSNVKFLWQHKETEVIGYPIEMKVVPGRGLWVKACFLNDDDFPTARKAYKLAKLGLVNRFSIGYLVHNAEPKTKTKGKKRLLKEIEVLEFSLVTIPDNDAAQVLAVKNKENSMETELKNLREDVLNAIKDTVREVVETELKAFLNKEVEAESVETEEVEAEEKSLDEDYVKSVLTELKGIFGKNNEEKVEENV